MNARRLKGVVMLARDEDRIGRGRWLAAPVGVKACGFARGADFLTWVATSFYE
jgi:hypothetical protein